MIYTAERFIYIKVLWHRHFKASKQQNNFSSYKLFSKKGFDSEGSIFYIDVTNLAFFVINTINVIGIIQYPHSLPKFYIVIDMLN